MEVTRLVPAWGNLTVCGQQFWQPQPSRTEVTLWADTTVVHLPLDGVRLKPVPSRLTPPTCATSPTTADPPGRHQSLPAPIEFERLVNATGLIILAGRQHPVGYHFAGRRLTVRLDRGLMQINGHGILLRSLPNPNSPAARRGLLSGRRAPDGR
ncbi:hypothetical protein [Micromonospora chokoriensis]|uniref:hypothetical protein n=1 Tax=Micromonospora chokoriensis TaxID=356851 RepID=UPI000B5B0B63|nr:hypothetical protein [Micromonospora chokoriensis]